MSTSQQDIIERGNNSILGTYKRFPLAISHGKGSYLFDVTGKKYLDFGSGIAVTSLGHAHPEITASIGEQSSKLLHCSNLYYSVPQIELAEKLVSLIAPGKIFFCNSGAEANECMIKLARAYGHATGRYEIISMQNSFHGRTMAGISATGQEKVKKGFTPLLDGFVHVPFNSMDAITSACNTKTIAVMIEGIQGEGGIIPANPEYLLKLREFCTANNLLLLFDAVQCGFFRSGSFQSYQEILSEMNTPFLPDAIAMAKSLGGGFPLGACWISDAHAKYLGPGTHGSTYGGNPSGCEAARKIIEIIERDNLIENIRSMGGYLKESLASVQETLPNRITEIRGMGLLQGCVLSHFQPPEPYSTLPPSSYICLKALEHGLLLVPAGDLVVRFMPQFQVSKAEIDEGIRLFLAVIKDLG
jgi:acetylornithine/N-succinyldiaminopimelate aminotransferase